MSDDTKRAIFAYLNDVTSSAPGAYDLKALITEEFALAPDEAAQVMREWWATWH
jgi:hypothetical protein